jgi:hypothetical protein
VAAAGRPQKLRVSDPALAAALQASGGRVLADYGSFQLIEADDPTPARGCGNGVEVMEAADMIQLNARQLDTRAPEIKALRNAVGPFNGRRLHLVQFVGPVKPEWREALEQSGVRIVHYVPQNAYLVQGDAKTLAAMQNWAEGASSVQWEGGYADDYKLHPKARTTDAKGNPQKLNTDSFTVQLLEDADLNPATLALIAKLQLEPAKRQFQTLHYVNIVARFPADRLAEIAAQPDVIAIQPYYERHKMDEQQDQIVAGNLSGNVPSGPGYLAWLAGKGFTQPQFTASGFVVDVSDSGIDNGTTAPGHFGLYQLGDPTLSSRVAYTRLEGTPNTGTTLQGCDGHGNLNSHIIGGFNAGASGFPHTDASGFHYGLGVCPFVKLGSSVIFDTDKFTDPSYNNLQSRAYRDGARLSSNSWGADTAGDYDADAQNYDALVRDAQPSGSAVPTAGNQEMVIVFAAGNAGPSAQTVGSPGTAKNVIVVGAAENVHSHSIANGGNDSLGNDGCSTPDTEANNANDIASFSSRGPCSDGRVKPDLVAPGTHVTGGVPQSSTTTNGSGAAIACFKATGVCALPGGGTVGNANNFFPLNQQFYTTSSGTSHSTPAVAGACALVRQYFINNGPSPASPAMTKAFLMNSCRYMTGVSAGDTLPSSSQGMGELNLGMAFDGVPRMLRDEVGADKFTATGQTRTFSGTITDPSKPFRVTLAWTDTPASLVASAILVNDLNLTVTVGGNTYKGNVFSGASSVTGGSADSVNNVESVFLPAGLSGSFVVTVSAANITGDGVPNNADALDQDFALVIYNGAAAVGPVISADSFTLMAESCAPGNGAVDPNETVTVNFALRNIGTTATTNLVATLQATSGLSAVSGPQNYGALSAGGAAATQAYSFTANGTCGSNVLAVFSLGDGPTNLGTVTFTIPLGAIGQAYAQDFDGVAAPTLPIGWSTTASGAQSAWVTSTRQRDTLPNAAFSPDPGSVGVNELVSPPIAISSASAQLTFRHSYNLESGLTTAYDGGVLEIKIGTGPWTDILAAGGSFVSGGYNLTISSSYSNPLAGRQAWSGSSGGFVTTVVGLPTAAANQNVQFRWRCATDSSNSGVGWYVDSVAVEAQVCCGAGSFGLPTLVAGAGTVAAENCVAPNGAIDPGETVTVNLTLANIGTTNTTTLVGTLQSGGGVTSPGAPQTFGTVVAGGAAVARPFTFTASGACGGTINATLQLQDGGLNLGTLAYSWVMGVPSVVFAQNFDLVSVPSLPGGWTTTSSGGQTKWQTDSTSSDTAPNSAFSAEASTIGVNELVTPVILLPPGASQLSFRNSYDLETGSTTAYDGGVLEIKIGAGAWTDILAAGGSFVSGGYNLTVSSSYGNPLAGRQAWSGNSGGFITTAVNLPAAAAGQSVQLKWRCGTDSSVSVNGWRIDTIALTARACCSEVTLGASASGTNGQFQFTVSGTAGHNWVIEASTNLGLTNWVSLATNVVNFTDTNTAGMSQRFYRARLLP